ncbi:MAG: phytanoyl-CoA dioxygenase family protein [Cyclobacteriaceae bacterium]|nr:phytanoyl-CoA dioxygenase family protein [Cyclobacteriaceae bacterium]
MLPPAILRELADPFPLSEEQIAFYQKNRFIKLKQVFSEELLNFFSDRIASLVTQKSAGKPALDGRDTYGKAFLQIMNLWREDEVVRALVMSRRLGGIASGLMQVRGVRIYHDQALFKEGGGGITPWHADQYYWPLETDKTVTAWIPLHAVPLEMGPLEFSAGSHVITDGRDLKISDDSEKAIERRLRVTDFPHVVEPFDLGEVSFHSGWIFHRAGANTTREMRKVMTIIYMDKDMRLKAPENENQKDDWEVWCPGATIGEIIDTPLNPTI